MKVDVLMPTLGLNGDETEVSLGRLPFDWRLIKSDARGWPQAMNECLSRREPGRDALLIDDDVVVLPDTFGLLPRYQTCASVFGFKLLFPDGTVQHAGTDLGGDGLPRHTWWREVPPPESDMPAYVPHVTTSLCYVKADALNRLAWRFPEWPGAQGEDCAFSLSALKAGLRIIYLPGEAIHHESRTKRAIGALVGQHHNYNALRAYCDEHGLHAVLRSRFPDGRRLPVE